MRKLFRHQRAALDFLRKRNHAALFMEMRLGKTLVAIRRVQELECRRVLVVAPLTVLAVWERELRLEGETFAVAHGLTRDKRVMLQVALLNSRKERTWLLTNYETLHQYALYGYLRRMQVVILDESTRIKNPKAQITKACVSLFVNAEHRILLTGTPLTSGWLDIFTQMKFLVGGFCGFKNYWYFRDKFFFASDGYNWVPKLGKSPVMRKDLGRYAFVLNRKQVRGMENVRVYERRCVVMSGRARKKYNEMMCKYVNEYGDTTRWIVVLQSWLARYAARQHRRELMYLLNHELPPGDPVVVWFRFNDDLRSVKQLLKQEGVTCAAVCGETSTTERHQIFSRFQRGLTRVLLVQIACCRFGVDLSRASTAIFFSNSYSMEDRKQAEDRIVHPRKKDPLLFLDLVTQDTIEEDILDVLRLKFATTQQALRALLQRTRRRIERANPR